MKDVVGSPGTGSSLVLRVSQCVCAAASMAAIFFAHGSSNYTAFGALGVSMELLAFWSFFRACHDVKSLWNKLDPHNSGDVFLIFIGDWLMAILSLASASASGGVAIYLERDFHFCRTYPQLSCNRYDLAVILAFVAWSFISASAVSSFWLLS